jgi:hypothetical protein
MYSTYYTLKIDMFIFVYCATFRENRYRISGSALITNRLHREGAGAGRASSTEYIHYISLTRSGPSPPARILQLFPTASPGRPYSSAGHIQSWFFSWDISLDSPRFLDLQRAVYSDTMKLLLSTS